MFGWDFRTCNQAHYFGMQRYAQAGVPAANKARFEGVVVADVDLVEGYIERGECCFGAEEEMSHGRSWTVGAYDHAPSNVRAVFEGRCDARSIRVIGDLLKGFVILQCKLIRTRDTNLLLTDQTCH